MGGSQFQDSAFNQIDLERMDAMVWLLSRRKSGMFLVELSVFGEDDEEKSRHVVTVDKRAVDALVYDSVESHAMILIQEVLKICSGYATTKEVLSLKTFASW